MLNMLLFIGLLAVAMIAVWILDRDLRDEDDEGRWP